jgi:hypothetical protein
VRRWLFENSLSVTFGVLFLAALGGQSVAGWKDHNADLTAHGDATIGYGRYLLSSEYGAAVLENWQSEYLQFFTFILATVWLVQKGSNESKRLEDVGLESDKKQRVGAHAPENAPRFARAKGLLHTLYANSLLIVMGLLFVGSWFGQSVTAWTIYNADRVDHEQSTVSWGEYVLTPDFWEKSLQNWQSEFLAVGTMAVFTIYLRQRGSPESKPVGAPHDETGSSG